MNLVRGGLVERHTQKGYGQYQCRGPCYPHHLSSQLVSA